VSESSSVSVVAQTEGIVCVDFPGPRLGALKNHLEA
jgi:hypothetical protein